MDGATEPIRSYDLEIESFPEEELLIQAWRRKQLQALGLPRVLAALYADLVDWHEVAALVGRGCPPELALEIVR
jgi:hypothetical protein